MKGVREIAIFLILFQIIRYDIYLGCWGGFSVGVSVPGGEGEFLRRPVCLGFVGGWVGSVVSFFVVVVLLLFGAGFIIHIGFGSPFPAGL